MAGKMEACERDARHDRAIRHFGAGAALIALGALVPLAANAQVAPTSLPTPGTPGWQYSATVYLWAPSVGGSSRFPADSGGTDLTVSAEQILDRLKFAAMGTFGAHNGTWGVFTDLVYLHFGGGQGASRDFTIGNIGLPADASANFNWTLKGFVWTTAGEYRVVSDPSWTLDVLGGVRWLDIHQTLSWDISGSIGTLDPLARSGSANASQSVLDAVVGFKGRFAFGSNREWFVPYYFDIGAGQSQSTLQAAAGLGYTFKWGEITAMYRYLDYRMKDNKVLQDINFGGPLLAATWRW
jgi:hypothetical protein